MTDSRTITRMLHECRESDNPRLAFDTLMPLVYDDLKMIARKQLRRLRPGKTLNTTALVHDSYSKLEGSADLEWTDRRHFFAVAARAMRQVVVDHARSRMSAKNQGNVVPVDLESIPGHNADRADEILYVNQLLERLEQINPELVHVIECKYYAGYTQEETADVLGLSLRTTQRRWTQACAWLQEFATAD